MSNKKGSRGIPVNMGEGSLFSSPPLKTSSKGRKQEAEAAAAAVIEAAEAEKAKQVESDRLYKEYMKMHQPPKPPKSVTCALCKKSETVGDAIAHKWKKHDLFANQAICSACDAETVPFTASPKFVWKREPNMLSAQQARLLKLLERAPPPNKLKAKIAETAVFDLTPKQREASLISGMHKQLSAKLLTPPVAEVTPFTEDQLAKFTRATYTRNRGGTKFRSRSKRSRSRSRSRSRAHGSK
jgi:hypothetical protein